MILKADIGALASAAPFIGAAGPKVFAVKAGLVRVEGLEPPRVASPEPKSGASTNSTIPAGLGVEVCIAAQAEVKVEFLNGWQ